MSARTRLPRFQFDAKRYPTTPGCYLMKDAKGQVIYVGKAKDLRDRLSSYFRRGRKRRRTQRLVARIADIEIILLNNEIESLVLENNLIKRHKPSYNRKLVDEDSGYFYIVLTEEEHPRLVAYRKHRINKELRAPEESFIARRFGPYITRRFRDVLLGFVTENY